MNDVLFAFSLTALAGAATGIGGLVAILSRSRSKKFLAICLSLAAGVMLYISFVEILGEAFETLESVFGYETYVVGYGYEYGGYEWAYLIVTVAFFAGIALMALVDKFISHDDKGIDLLELKTEQELKDAFTNTDRSELKRTGVMSTVAIAVHNFPEGLVTFLAAMHSPALGIGIAIAIAIHNIPEGIAVAAPIYYATGSKVKAVLTSIFAGLTEPLGGLVAWIFLRNFVNDLELAVGIAFAAAGGIMVFVAVHQLLPAAHKYGKHHGVMRWLFAGMGIMAVSLIALEFVL
jgi:ZIP family zinc transporter